MNQATQMPQDSAGGNPLYMAMELSKKSWKLAFSDGRAESPRVVAVPARDWERLEREAEKAKLRFGLAGETDLRSCYEAGRDGFWIHRALVQRGTENLIVDPASMWRLLEFGVVPEGARLKTM